MPPAAFVAEVGDVAVIHDVRGVGLESFGLLHLVWKWHELYRQVACSLSRHPLPRNPHCRQQSQIIFPPTAP